MNSIIVKKSLSIIIVAMIVAVFAFQWKICQSSEGSTFIERDSSQIELPQSIQDSFPDTTNFKTPEKKMRFDRPSQIKKKQNRSQWSEPSLHEINYQVPKKKKRKRRNYL